MEVKSTVDEAVGAVNEIKSFWQKLFGTKTTKPVAQEKRKQEAYVALDETKVMTDIVSQLTTFFRLQDQLAAVLREEELKSKTVYDPDANLMEAALNRIIAQDQMAALEVEIRECMVYRSPKEMGALYSRTFETRDIIMEEQEQARLREEAKERVRQWQRAEEKRDFRAKSAYLVATAILITYLWLLFLFVAKLEKT
jgi:hypothetical protein